jgi:hypothetical protein
MSLKKKLSEFISGFFAAAAVQVSALSIASCQFLLFAAIIAIASCQFTVAS